MCSFFHPVFLLLPLFSGIFLASLWCSTLFAVCWWGKRRYQKGAGCFVKWSYRGESKKKTYWLIQGHFGEEGLLPSPTVESFTSLKHCSSSKMAFCRLCTVLLLIPINLFPITNPRFYSLILFANFFMAID